MWLTGVHPREYKRPEVAAMPQPLRRRSTYDRYTSPIEYDDDVRDEFNSRHTRDRPRVEVEYEEPIYRGGRQAGDIENERYRVNRRVRDDYEDEEFRSRPSRLFLREPPVREPRIVYENVRREPTLPVRFNDYEVEDGEPPIVLKREREREREREALSAERHIAREYRRRSPSPPEPVTVQEYVVVEEARNGPTLDRVRSSHPPPDFGNIRYTGRKAKEKSEPNFSYIREERVERRRYSSSAESEEANPDTFRLSRHTKDSLTRDFTIDSSADASLNMMATVVPTAIAGREVLDVLDSHYRGDGSVGGFHSAEMKVIESVGLVPKKSHHPVFKWM